MSTNTGDETKKPTFTQSQKDSAYFNMDDGYDPAVYENTWLDIAKITGMLIIFYIFQGMHWWANFCLGVNVAETSTTYNLIIFGTGVIIIICMVWYGSYVNQLKMTHEFYMEKISEEKLRLADEQAKVA